MPSVNVVATVDVAHTPRVKQLSALFDVPLEEKLTFECTVDVPLEEKPWTIGLIVGPSGSGKSLVAREMFGDKLDRQTAWDKRSVFDNFDKSFDLKQIADACSSVGFNTIPSWMKPYHVLSNGEKFRIELVRRILTDDDIVVIDEFTSVVDRQVAKIASHAIQKYFRKKVTEQQFVAVSCHSDIIDWLQPDWVLQPHTREFHWRLLQRRPVIKGEIQQIELAAWQIFAPYHYMNTTIHRAARCFGLFVENEPVSFVGVLHRPISSGKNKGETLMAETREVTLPDWQGLGLMSTLRDNLGAIYRAANKRYCTYPAHPMVIRSLMKKNNWKLTKKPGYTRPSKSIPGFGGRPNAVFEYCGPCSKLDISTIEKITNLKVKC